MFLFDDWDHDRTHALRLHLTSSEARNEITDLCATLWIALDCCGRDEKVCGQPCELPDCS